MIRQDGCADRRAIAFCTVGALLAALGAPACARGSERCGPGTVEMGDICVADGPGDGTGAAGGTAGTGAAGGGAGSSSSSSGGSSSGAPGCQGGHPKPPPGAVSIAGSVAQIIIDPCGEHVYVSNTSQNRIEDYVVAEGKLAAPIPVGSQPFGFDVTPDNGRLYVANRGGANISVVDLAAHQELKKIEVPSDFSGDTPLSLAISSAGKAIFSTTFSGSGFGGRVLGIDIATEEVSPRVDFFAGGSTTEATVLIASADHGTIAAVAGDISSAPVFIYHASADAFGPEHDLNGFIEAVTVNADGSRVIVDATYVLSGSLNLLGTIGGGGMAAAFAPDGSTAYRSTGSMIEVLDTTHFVVTGTIPLPDPSVWAGAGGMVVSPDGKWLAVVTAQGFSVVDLP